MKIYSLICRCRYFSRSKILPFLINTNIFFNHVVNTVRNTHRTQTQQHETSYNVIRSFTNLLVRRMMENFFIDV